MECGTTLHILTLIWWKELFSFCSETDEEMVKRLLIGSFLTHFYLFSCEE